MASLPEPAGPPDFDTRPCEPLRSTLPLWISECVACGYAAEDLSSASEAAVAVVRSDEFAQARVEALVTPEARKFLVYAFLLDRLNQPADAGWSSLHGAWATDDLGDAAGAIHCRQKAVAYWRRGKAEGVNFGADLVSEFALITDVYRRAGEFEQATVACSEGLDNDDVPPALEAVLRRQLTLIQRRDVTAHSLAELLSQK
ncbi:MAG: hypothetical protein H7039_13065 [Bryobacteraceae bacterium]|nr:hypothetical protein [Bryobacteraceae bacterium]